MKIRHDRIGRVQAGMREHGLAAIIVMNHDDFRYLFGEDRAQPRAIVPAEGRPEIVAFIAEEPSLRDALGPDAGVQVFTSVGGQIHDVVGRLRELVGDTAGAKPKIGMQMWFDTPAFLVDLFRRVNPQVELVSSDSVMDPIRGVKDEGELEAMTEAQRVAGRAMDVVRSMLAPGVSPREIATEAMCAMLHDGAERTSTPIHVNVGPDTCMLHGRVSSGPIEQGDLVVVDLTPQIDGYCANLARTFVVGEPDERQCALFDAYAESIEAVRPAMRPGVTVAELDAVAGEVYARRGLAAYQVNGIGHGLGLRFEETPASTIIPPHRHVPLRAGMTMTIGHTILAIPGTGGVRYEDVYRVTDGGAEPLAPYPIEPVVTVS